LGSTNDEVVIVDRVPTDQNVHPVMTATMDDFDGEAFNIDGVSYQLKDVKVDYLRKFCVKIDIRTSTPPYKTVRSAKKAVVIEAIKAKKGRMLNDEPDPWKSSKDDKEKGKSPPVNRYRLANVVFSEECRQMVSNRGKTLQRPDLDIGLKTDQRVYEKVAAEYNKKGIPTYDDIQFPNFTITGANNLPSEFQPIDWEEAKKVTKDCIHKLEKARKNFEVSGCHDSDLEDAAETNGMRIGKFTNYHYVLYWNLFADLNQELFTRLTGELEESVFTESAKTSNDTLPSNKKKRKSSDILADVFHSSTETDKRRIAMEEKRLTIDNERNALLKEQVAAVKKQAAAVQQVCDAEKLHKLTQDQSLLRQQQHEYRATLVKRYGSRQEVKRRMKEHLKRKSMRAPDDDGSSSEESNASMMDEMDDIANRLKRIQQDIVDHYNIHTNEETRETNQATSETNEATEH
jgi:hypothetical protein